jgi:histidine triad (HIT) family protein
MSYDTNNIFAKILRKEIPCNPVVETPHTLAFNDIAPQAPTHILIIPKDAYVTYGDFINNASPEEILDFNQTIATLIEQNGLNEAGYRIISNAGEHGGQEVPHFHVHLLGGRHLGNLLQE